MEHEDLFALADREGVAVGRLVDLAMEDDELGD